MFDELDIFVAQVIQFAEDKGFSVVLDNFTINNGLTGSGAASVTLNFTILIVDKNLSVVLDNIIALRQFVLLDSVRLGQKLLDAALNATKVQLSTNVTDNFGTGYTMLFPVICRLEYMRRSS
jgi:hypothetical protein